MGLSSLYLVKPKQFPDEQAVWRAAGAADLLEQAVVVDNLDQALEGCAMVVGTSARGRRIPWPLLNPRDTVAEVYPLLSKQPVAVLFGREDRGLTNEELQRCHLHVNIPANDDYSSLNLAMAVQIVCYELRMRHLQDSLSADPQHEWDQPWATVEEQERFFVHLEQVLLELGFLKPAAPKQLMTRLRRLFSRTRLDEMEVSILRGVLTRVQQRLQGETDKD